MGRLNLILGHDRSDYLLNFRALLKSFPNQQSGLVQLVISFGVEVDQDAFASIELSADDLIAAD